MENKTGTKLFLGIIIGLIIGGIIAGVSTYFCMNSKKTENVATGDKTKENKNDRADQTVVDNDSLSGQYYLFGGVGQKRRYYLALTDADMTANDKDKKTYLIDMNLSDSKPSIKEINLSELIQPLYEKKINSLPTTLAEGTINAMPKSKCESYSIQYGDAMNDAYMTDWTKEIAFTVNYACNFTHEAGGKATMGLGTEIYALNIDTMKTYFVASKD